MSFDLTNKNISDTFQNLLQKTGSSNQLYDLVGNAVEDLTIKGTIRAQSYIVSESIVVATSGSTIFGNSAADDTHQFTGSISSTGIIVGNDLKNQENNPVVFSTETGSFLQNSVTASSLVRNISTGSFLTTIQAGSNQGVITKTSQDVVGAVISIPDLTTTGNPTFNHITASGEISASGKGTFNRLHVGPTQAIDYGQELIISGSTPEILLFSGGTHNEFLRIGVEETNGDMMIGWDHEDDLHLGTFTTAIRGDWPGDNSIDTKMIIQSTGNVGIGTATPTKTLEVAGDISASGDFSAEGNITGSNISASGNLKVAGSTTTNGHLYVDGNAYLTDVFPSGDVSIDEGKKVIFDSNDTYIMANTDNPEDLEIHADENIHLKADGTVYVDTGINSILDVAGTVKVGNRIEVEADRLDQSAGQLLLKNDGNLTGAGILSIPGIILQSGSTTIDMKWRGSDAVIGSEGTIDPYTNVGALRFSSSYGGTVVFDYSKEATVPYVGIGNSYPSKPLTVQGDISASGIIHSGLNPVVLSTQTGSFLVNSDTGSMGNSIVNGTLSVNTTHTPSGSLSVNYGDGATMTGSIGTAGHGYGDITEIGGGSISAGRVYALEEDGDWAETAETGPISSSLLCVGLADGKKLLRGTVNITTGDTTTIGQKVYAGASGRGVGTAPSDSGDVVRVVGYTLSGSVGANGAKIYFNPDNTWVEVS